ncbi:MAG: Spy/CpxP family protein refolding chaperone [Rhodocyclaceae bacterium]|jgi:Spy/CpxP family protein refolding chaperone|nr:Spy/CpxP family protein refolding chaperone [Rhodocyclaceae bacterium]
MKTRTLALAATLAAGLALAVPATLHARPMMDGPNCPMDGGGMMHRMGPEGGMPGMMGGAMGHGMMRGLHALDLSDAQKDKIFALMHAQGPAMYDGMKTLRNARIELQKLTQAERYDEAAVKALTEKSAKTLAELAQAQARAENQIHQLLTPEQRKELASYQESRGGMMRGGPGMGPGKGMLR